MRKMNWAVLFTALVSVFTLSSCIDSEEGETYDLYEYVTVEDFMGTATLIGDQSGFTYVPVSSDVIAALQLKDGSYYKRALVAIQLAEPFSAEKSRYNITGISVYNYVPYKGFNENSDTLDIEGYGDYKFQGLTEPWVRSGYVNVPFSINIPTTNPSLDDFHLYVTGANTDTLFTKLRYTKDNSSAYNIMTEMVSFELPSNDPAFMNLRRDSIVVNIEAKGPNGDLKATSKKFHFNELF